MEFFNLHTHKSTNQTNVFELVNQYPQDFDPSIPFYSIGIHPWYIVQERLEIDLAVIENKVIVSNCLAIGECGLDKRIAVPMELQQLVFEKQLLLAQKHNKPVLIHCVAAFQEIIEIKNRLAITIPLIIHGFSKNSQIANQLISNDFYLSFGKYLIRNPDLEAVFKSITDDRLFLETDTIEEGIQTVYQLAAKYKGISIQEMQRLINSNFLKIFKLEC